MATFKRSMALITLFSMLAVATVVPIAPCMIEYHSNSLSITASASKRSYYLREPVNIQGTLTHDGLPVSTGLVAIEVRDPSGLPVAFRTKSTGDVNSTAWSVDFTALYPCNSIGEQKCSFTVKETICIFFAVKNFESTSHIVTVTVSLYDGNGILLGVWIPIVSMRLDPAASASNLFMAMTLPDWASPGNATIFGSIFTGFPKDAGVPYCPEEAAVFEIKRNPNVSYCSIPSIEPPTANGTYLASLKFPPDARSGEYTASVSTIQNYTIAQNETTFEIESASYPPQASFTYYPVKPYVNMSITFDASSSTAEGYNDTIVGYEWDFGDGKGKHSTTSPTYAYSFNEVKTYTVTLNVTDTEGLWSTTSKPITILPPTGPTADFIWSPTTPLVNQLITFDASNSVPGWNGTGQPPIVTYQWDFGDGNVTSTGSKTITHQYLTNTTYTVVLTVIDGDGATGNETQQLTVDPIPALIGDINGDGYVELLDFFLLSQAFGSYPGRPNWDPRCDIYPWPDGDGYVELMDFYLASQHFGDHIPQP